MEKVYVFGHRNPDTDSVPDDKLTELDKWALMKLDSVIDKVNEGYNNFDFHIAFHAIHNFCVTDMSNFYLDIIKDRLYCEKEDSEIRRSAQTTMYRILSAVARLSAPIISFTAEEIWSYMPHSSSDDAESIFLNQMPEKSGISLSDEFVAKWDFIYSNREAVNKVIIHCNSETAEKYKAISDHLSEILIVSDVEVSADRNDSETEFEVVKAEGGKCERCWTYSTTVGSDSEHPTLCERCCKAVR